MNAVCNGWPERLMNVLLSNTLENARMGLNWGILRSRLGRGCADDEGKRSNGELAADEGNSAKDMLKWGIGCQ